jgi:hypothetical protein
LAIDPLVIAHPALKGFATVKLEARLQDPWQALREFFRQTRRKTTGSLDSQHDFYIADMNLQNRAYIDELKIQAIRSAPAGQTFDEFLESVKTTPSYSYLTFTADDKALYEQATGKSRSQVKITPLVFEDADGAAFVDGSGGLQFISEYLASRNDSALSTQVVSRDNGTLIGVFAAGGGTGAGAVLGALSKYKQTHNRYTLGVAVLPDRHETEAQARAGRFFVRYLSRDLSFRPDTILMFSNEAAYRALAADEAAKKLEELKLQAHEVVNWYLKKFLFFYSQINQPRNEALIGKVFDPNDFKYGLAGTAFIGFASSASEDFEPADLFAQALAPMRFSRDSIAGLAVGFGFDDDASKRVLENLKRIMESSSDSHERAEEVRAASRFYGSIRQLCVFFFVSDRVKANSINKIMPDILRCCESLTGGTPSLVIAAYHIDGLPDNAVMILGKGGYIGESLRHLEAYLRQAFFAGEDRQAATAIKAIREAIQRCNKSLASEEVKAEKEQLVATLRDLRDEGPEQLSTEVTSALENTDRLRQIIESKDFSSNFYVTWGDVISAALTLAEWAVIPKGEDVFRF